MKITIKAKIIINAVILSLVVLIMVGFTFVRSQINAQVLSHLQRVEREYTLATEIELDIINTWQYLTDASLTQDLSVISQDADATKREALSQMAELRDMDPAFPPLLDSLKSSFNAFWDTGIEMQQAYAVSKEEGDVLMDRFDGAAERMLLDLDKITDPIEEHRSMLFSQYSQQVDSTNMTLLLIAGLIVVIALAMGFLMANRITKPLNEVIHSLKELASSQGDLTFQLDLSGRDEMAQMAKWFNQFLEKIRHIHINIEDLVYKNEKLGDHLGDASKQTAESVSGIVRRIYVMQNGAEKLDDSIQQASSATEEIMQSINSLNDQVEQQFSAIELSSSSTEEIMASVNNVAMIAENRLSSMDKLVALIKSGGGKVEETSRIIQEIQKNADDMMDMIDIINNISSQTNLLAMNASIEAAHAGEAGRGFAVVADEIRKLAEDTGDNAARIAQSLNATTERIHEATDSGMESEKALGVIENEVGLFSNALQEVSASMGELSQASNEILNSVTTLMTTSEVVRDASSEMKVGSEETLKSILQIKDISADSLKSMDRVMERTEQLDKVSLQVSAFGNQNKYNNRLLVTEVVKFDTGHEVDRTKDISVGIDWSDVLSVGISKMDDEHKELFIRINALLSALLGKTGEYDMGQLVGFINEYVDFHFRDEEKYMESVGYPDLENHKKLHAIYEEYFAGIEKELKAGNFNASLLIEIQEKVINWLLDHIAQVDHKYGQWVAQKEGREL